VPEGLPGGGIEPIGDPRSAKVTEEDEESLLPESFGDEVEEETTVEILAVPSGPEGRGTEPLVHALHPSLPPESAQRCLKEGPVGPTCPGMQGLDVDPYPFDDEVGESRGRKIGPCPRHPPEEGAKNPARRARDFEVEDVSHLVQDDGVKPLFEKGAIQPLDRGLNPDDDPVRGSRLCGPVCKVEMIGEEEVNRSGWRGKEPLCEKAVGGLGPLPGSVGRLLYPLGKGDAEVRRMKGSIREIRRRVLPHPRCRKEEEEKGQQSRDPGDRQR
jgi:hypothetical protein